MPPGFFGKIPSHGDFVSRRFPRPLLEPWDAWLQAGLTRSREQLDADWLASYLASPIWYFALGELVCEGGAVLGVLMPSVDKVGRHFPLTIATRLPLGADLPACLRGSADWFEAVDALARSALESPFDLEAFDRELGSERFELDLLSGDPSVGGGDHMQHRALLPDCSFAQAVGSQSGALLAVSLARYSLWWTEGLQEPAFLIQPGLPPAESFAGLLSGRWG
jgi:type VI secretion system protein ImpM